MLYAEYLNGALADSGASAIDGEIYRVLEKFYNAHNDLTKEDIYRLGKQLHDLFIDFNKKTLSTYEHRMVLHLIEEVEGLT